MPNAASLLRHLRYEADVSAKDVADAVGISEGSVRNTENRTTTASMRLIHRYARFYSDRLGREINALDLIDETPDRGAA